MSEGFKGGTRGSPIMPRDAVSRTANVERNGGHKWVKNPLLRTSRKFGIERFTGDSYFAERHEPPGRSIKNKSSPLQPEFEFMFQ